MIIGLICKCANSEVRFRNILLKAGVDNYIGAPAIIGKDKCREYLRNLPSVFDNDPYVASLDSLIDRSAGYIAVVGIDEESGQLRWSDVYRNNLEAVGLAEKIIETFA